MCVYIYTYSVHLSRCLNKEDAHGAHNVPALSRFTILPYVGRCSARVGIRDCCSKSGLLAGEETPLANNHDWQREFMKHGKKIHCD